jgi:uncharacterized protein
MPIRTEPGGTRVTRCAICGDDVTVAFKPFCSRRCADIDLARWLQGNYAVPGGDVDADEDGDDAAAGRGGTGGRDPDGDGH